MTRALVLADDHKRWHGVPHLWLRLVFVLMRRRQGLPWSWVLFEATGMERLCRERFK
jgi:hypothetical protein